MPQIYFTRNLAEICQQINCFPIAIGAEDPSKEIIGLKPTWLPEKQWSDLLEASKGVKALTELLGHFLTNREEWRSFHASTDHSTDVPQAWRHLK